jgi:predicted O-methyltransferase YrrM
MSAAGKSARAVRRLARSLRPARRGRSLRFRRQAHDRFWWHRLEATDYVPPLYAGLTRAEWRVMDGWYAETAARGRVAEINVPAMSFCHGLIGGNGIRRVVQLGHYYGYSALLLGFLLRSMGARPGLVTIDLDPEATDFTREWVRRARLQEFVHVEQGDSAAAASADRAQEILGGAPELILVDSAHVHRHTIAELELWTPRVPAGGIMLFHDASEFAAGYDAHGEGGVRRAVVEWLDGHPEMTGMLLNGDVREGADANRLAYKDGAGLAILQRAG